MQIFVNDQELDVALDTEQRLGEVVAGVQSWLTAGRMRITDMQVDDTVCPMDKPADWQDRPLEQVGVMTITARRLSDIHLEQILTLREFFATILGITARAKESMKADSDTRRDIQVALQELPHVAAALQLVAPDVLSDDETSPAGLGRRLAALSELPEGDAGIADHAVRLSRSLELILDLLDVRAREVAHPVAELTSTIQVLQGTLPSLGEVAVQLQTGKDAQAIASIVRFAELTSKLVRILPYFRDDKPDLELRSGDGVTVEELASTLNETLSELADAFAAGDYVLIGDLCEYELTPKMSALLAALKEAAGQ